MGYRNLLAVTPEVAALLTTLRSIVLILTAIAAIIIIVSVLIQPSNPDGGKNVITGTNDSYYAQNKGRSKEGMLKKATIILSIIIVACVVVYFILTAIYPYAG